MIKILTILLCLFNLSVVNAQFSEKKLEQLYKDITISKKNTTNFEKSIEEVQNWFVNSELKTDEHKLKGYLIIAYLWNFQGDLTQSIKYAEEGRSLALNSRQFLWEARFLGFISTIYRQSNMDALGKEKLEDAISISHKAPQTEELNRFMANAYHELAYYAAQNKDFENALVNIKLSIKWAEKIETSTKDFFIATNFQYTGLLFNQMSQPDSALLYLQKAQNLTGNSTGISAKSLQNYIYNFMAEAYLMKKEPAKAKKLLDKVVKDSTQYKTTDLNYEVFKNLLNYYNTTANKDSIKIFKHKTDSITALINTNTSATINNVTSTLSAQNRELQEKTRYNYRYTLLLLLLLGAILIYFIKKRKPLTKSINTIERVPPLVKTEELNIAKDTFENLKRKMSSFEEQQHFLDPNISSTVIANQFETNTKYITYVIRKLYNQDFTTYINTLRINHICRLLVNDQKYRQYKISYLAEAAGFSSHSKFASVFKKIKGISPSEFIANLGGEL